MKSAPELPAILGGLAIRPEGPPTWPIADTELQSALVDALRAGTWGWYDGPHTAQLEALLCKWFASSAAFLCASGTCAVEVAMKAAGVGPGDEVILSAYDYEPTFVSIHALQAKPVLIDPHPESPIVTADAIAEAITPQTRAVVVSHLHGSIAPIPEIIERLHNRRITIIEDAAQCLGGSVAGQKLGSMGDFSILSFGGSKLISAGRGGAILVRDSAAAQRVRLALRRGIQKIAPMSELQAIAVLAQWNALAEHTAARFEAVAHLHAGLTGCESLKPLPVPVNATPGYYKLGLRYDSSKFGISRERFCQAMRAEGFALDPGFRALHVGRSASRFRASRGLQSAAMWGESLVVLHHPILLQGIPAMDQMLAAVRKLEYHAERLRDVADGKANPETTRHG
ncbi:DegT/DnrJ/EryC1/StrS family aminotransferase [Tuwongella immobilis]|uniref:Aminotransferase class V domain-containing protein n=1 Tax=Tuwongella immobilis TaxID=692036 RepID=A0A6C2YLH0_9BACT|nr:aminotransferase class V-fold PLP-dependent enzyme [Tuwongella immobilis]VIP02420.1 1 aminotransferase : DegT/DnrJ/EryC1/StrS aminotransferase OS=Planctomyces maris DSM 8797 GN=PM8797T_06100 PE=3 SV=1: DegT_DnrJ_EryC1 [Tuwongella immobilis]VTS01345.1 1 aminotransferase : DegT/DnrJ/EryC1/StrS aminotransferase OS=Planctomyces maris DSM 8797 GN=PM8797T_06100 PE=3 SV=1: DegT_DnrJ_EryC1 [Tuwongella immobilis]